MKKYNVEMKISLTSFLLVWSLFMYGATEKSELSAELLLNKRSLFFVEENILKEIQNGDTKFSALELIGSTFDVVKIQSIIRASRSMDAQVYRWKKHLVVYGEQIRMDDLKNRLIDAYPKARIKIYERPFYSFRKSEHCKDITLAPEWEHVLLTAELVKDTVLQEEYMEYHATQFQKWPEVAEGFCNADFQQLQVFRSGKQLLLVISIPKGENLDELNPKTMENNPRMDEWNALMGKYQTGIKGAKSSETWVFLNKITQMQKEH